ESDREAVLLAVAQEIELRGPSQWLRREAVVKRVGIVDAEAVDFKDQVPALDAGPSRRPLGRDRGHNRARGPLEPKPLGRLRTDRLQFGPEPRPLDGAIATSGGGEHDPDHIARDRKTNPL